MLEYWRKQICKMSILSVAYWYYLEAIEGTLSHDQDVVVQGGVASVLNVQ